VNTFPMFKHPTVPLHPCSTTIVDAPRVCRHPEDPSIVFCTCDTAPNVIERACQALRAFVRLHPEWQPAIVFDKAVGSTDAKRVDKGVYCVFAGHLLTSVIQSMESRYPAVTMATMAAGKLFPEYKWAVQIEPDVVAVERIPDKAFDGLSCMGVQTGSRAQLSFPALALLLREVRRRVGLRYQPLGSAHVPGALLMRLPAMRTLGVWHGALDVMRVAAEMGRSLEADHDLVAACRALRPEWFVEVGGLVTLVSDDAHQPESTALVHCSPIRPWHSGALPSSG